MARLVLKSDQKPRHHGDRLLLSQGNYLLKINTPKEPEKVWLSLNGDKLNGQETNSLSTEITEDGFILKADIQSENCVVDWFIE
jgi:hypothetical protein